MFGLDRLYIYLQIFHAFYGDDFNLHIIYVFICLRSLHGFIIFKQT